jgi:lipoprotein-anchoring transpeptidase ErfK/SrfK
MLLWRDPPDSLSVGLEGAALHMLDAVRGAIVSLMAILAVAGPFSAAVFLSNGPPERRNSGAPTISSEAPTAWQALRGARSSEVAAPKPTIVASPDRRVPLPAPTVAVALDRVSLTRALQRELKRLGCYHGEIDGIWTSATRQATKAFVTLANAELPVTEPDEVLLALLQGNGSKVCTQHCQQAHNYNGTCHEEAVASPLLPLPPDRTVAPTTKSLSSGPLFEPPMALKGPKTENENPPAIASGEPRISKTPLSPTSIGNKAAAANGAPSPLITLVLKADLGAQQLTVLEDDTVMHVWPISSGVDGYPTPTGIFQPKSANKMWYSRQYDWTPMPYAVFFTRGVAFHGTNETSRLGKSASHGCVRLATSNAAQLFDLVHKHGFAQTSIIVYGTPKHDAPAIARRAPTDRSETALAAQRSPIQQSNRFPNWAAAAFNR